MERLKENGVEKVSDERKARKKEKETKTCECLNDEWMTGGLQSHTKNQETGREISPNDPFSRRQTKIAFNLHLGSVGVMMRMMMAL